MGKYLDLARQFEARRQEQEPSAPIPQSPSPFATNGHEEANSWRCRYCGQQATIDDVCLSDDRERTLTLWRCDPCQVVAVTPDAIRQPPAGWVKMTNLHLFRDVV